MARFPSPAFWFVAAVLAALYGGALLAGALVGRARGAPPPLDPAQLEQVEARLGRYRDGVRAGKPGTMARATSAVFVINWLGGIVQFSLFGLLVVPSVAILLVSGWRQGQTLVFSRGSRPLSTALYFFVGALEWASYPLLAAVGVQVALSWIFPIWLGATTRSALIDGALVIGGTGALLAVQASLEVLYVRAVLRRGGTGVPLAPW